MVLCSIALLYFSSPIVKEYLRVSTINKEIKQQQEIINNIDKSIEEIALMKSYIDSIIGTEKGNDLNENNIRYILANNLPTVKPADGLISRTYDIETKHFGIDVVNIEGTPIFAIADGQIVFSDFSDDFGNFIIIDHQNGYLSHYIITRKIFLKRGIQLKRET